MELQDRSKQGSPLAAASASATASSSLSTSSAAATAAKKPNQRHASSSAIPVGAMTMPASAGFGMALNGASPSYGKIDTYKRLEKLGEGTYATVYKGISHLNGKLVALKDIRLEAEEGAPCTAIREVSLLKGLKHANIVTLHDIIYTKDSLTLVFEYSERDLKMYMDDYGLIDLNNVKLFMFQLLRGLQYCHSRKVLHRDLKPQNILINTNGELKLADFGLARAKSVPSKTYTNEVVTIWYRPPDVLLGSVDYGSSIDIWGIGCIFAEMVSSRPLFPAATNIEQLNCIWGILGTPTVQAWPKLESYPDYDPAKYVKCPPTDLANNVPRLDRQGLELLYKLLQYQPEARCSAADALKHAYFAELGPAVHKIPVDASIFPTSQLPFTPEVVVLRQGNKSRDAKQRRASVRF